MKALRILIADDHALIRQGLRTILEAQPGWTICAEAENGRQAVKLSAEMTPDVVLLDVSMPELNGLDAIRQIRKAAPAAEVLILTMHESERLASDAFQAGARGCVLKSDGPRQLVAAVEAIAAHRPYFAGKIAGMLLDRWAQPDAGMAGEVGRPRLSPREREVVQLLAEGRTNKEVAVRLGVSPKTADAHRTNIMRRLNIHCVTELVRYAIREKIIEA